MLKTETYFSIFPVLMLAAIGQHRFVPSEVEKCPVGKPSVIPLWTRLTPLRFAQDDLHGQLHGEINRGDHAVGTGDSFAGNFKRSAVIGTGARKRKTECHIHALVKGMKFQRDQTLVVIHAEYRIEFAFNSTMKDGVGRVGATKSDL